MVKQYLIDRKMYIMSELLQNGQAFIAKSEHLAILVYRRVLPALSLCMALYHCAGLRCKLRCKIQFYLFVATGFQGHS